MKNIKNVLRLIFGRKIYETVLATWHLGYIPKTKNPRSFNEKIINRKLYEWRSVPPKLSDKFYVRAYVSGLIGPDYLNTIYGVYDNAGDIDFVKLPERFVIKATHGSNMNILVCDRNNFDEKTILHACVSMLSDKYGYLSNELWYLQLKPQLIIEKYLSDKKYGVPLDYKFFVMNGKVEFVQVDFDRFKAHSRTVFDRNWKPAAFCFGYPQGRIIKKPKLLYKMIELAERLASGFSFIRVDFYSPNDESVVFGELTFAPGSGWESFTPHRKYDFEIGKLWQINRA